MGEQKWKSDPLLYDAPTIKNGLQVNKKLDYDTTYRNEFLDADPLQDWDSIERCKWLWDWSIETILERYTLWNEDIPKHITDWTVLDVGTKDAQFPEWLREQGVMSIGLEYSEPYVRYAINKGRPSKYGNACDMPFDDGVFDYVFAHHLHGLLPDYLKGLQEMWRVSKRYMIALNQIPGNPRKHYSYIDSPQIYNDFIESVDACEVIYNDFLDTGYSNEWVIFLEKYESFDETVENIDKLDDVELEEGSPIFTEKKDILYRKF